MGRAALSGVVTRGGWLRLLLQRLQLHQRVQHVLAERHRRLHHVLLMRRALCRRRRLRQWRQRQLRLDPRAGLVLGGPGGGGGGGGAGAGGVGRGGVCLGAGGGGGGGGGGCTIGAGRGCVTASGALFTVGVFAGAGTLPGALACCGAEGPIRSTLTPSSADELSLSGG